MQTIRGLKREVGVVLAVGAIAALGMCSAAQAATFKTGGAYELPEGETLEDDLYVACKTVTINGTLKGDLFAAGENVEVSGTVTGTLVAAGNEVEVSGTVLGDINAAGKAVKLTGTCEDDVRVAGQSVTLSGTVAGDLLGAGENLTVKKSARVGADAFIAGAKLQFDEEASITGTLYLMAQGEPEIPEGVAGEVVRKTVPESKPSRGKSIVSWVLGTMASIAGFVLLGWIIHQFVPGLVGRPAAAIEQGPLNAALYGLVGALLFTFLPMATCLLVVLVVFQGIEAALGIMLLACGIILLMWNLSPLITGRWLMSRFSRSDGKDKLTALREFLMWVLLIALLGRIPYFGVLVYLASFVIAVGGIILSGRVRKAAEVSAAPREA